jgi:hypothetical protein
MLGTGNRTPWCIRRKSEDKVDRKTNLTVEGGERVDASVLVIVAQYRAWGYQEAGKLG